MLLNIEKLDRAEVLVALYNASKPQGLGLLHFTPEGLAKEEAKDLLRQDSKYFDYLKGRVMKVQLGTSILDAALYDRDNGEGAAERALAPLFEQLAETKRGEGANG